MTKAGGGEAGTAAGTKAARRALMALVVFALLVAIIVLTDAAGRYAWLKALHIVAIISWMAGLLYLPRLFIYHTDAEPRSVQSETFKVMEQRLLRVIMTPAMIISWVLGLWLAFEGGHYFEPWFVLKFLAVVALTGAHGLLARAVRLFGDDRNMRTARQWRMINEIPTVLMILIVVLVVVKPF